MEIKGEKWKDVLGAHHVLEEGRDELGKAGALLGQEGKDAGGVLFGRDGGWVGGWF